MAFPTALCTQCCLAALVITSGQKHKWQYEYSSVSQSRRFCTVLEHGLVLFLLRMVVVVHDPVLLLCMDLSSCCCAWSCLLLAVLVSHYGTVNTFALFP